MHHIDTLIFIDLLYKKADFALNTVCGYSLEPLSHSCGFEQKHKKESSFLSIDLYIDKENITLFHLTLSSLRPSNNNILNRHVTY